MFLNFNANLHLHESYDGEVPSKYMRVSLVKTNAALNSKCTESGCACSHCIALKNVRELNMYTVRERIFWIQVAIWS